MNFALNETAANLQLAEVCLRYHVYLCHIGCYANGNASNVQYALGKYAATYGMRHAEDVDRASWPLSLRQLIQYIFRDVGDSSLSLKEESGYPSHSIDDPPIHYAVEKGVFQVVKCLLDEKLADINAKSENREMPFIRGVINRDEEMVQLLLDRGADASATTEKGDSALLRANADEERKVLQALLSHKADIDAKNRSGEALIHLVTRAENTWTLRLVLDADADVNSRTHAGETALHMAARSTKDDNVKLLIDKVVETAADINAVNNAGETAVYIMVRTFAELGEV